MNDIHQEGVGSDAGAGADRQRPQLPGLSFGQALEEMKRGHNVARDTFSTGFSYFIRDGAVMSLFKSASKPDGMEMQVSSIPCHHILATDWILIE